MPDGKSMKMSDHQGMKMPGDKSAFGVAMDHGSNVWPHFANMILGTWLMTSVFALEYRSGALQASDAVSAPTSVSLE